MTDNSASSWIGPIIGIGLGLTALNILDKKINPRNRGYAVYIGYKVHRVYRNFKSAAVEADRLRSKGVKEVAVYNY